MLDDFRKQAGSSSFFDEEPEEEAQGQSSVNGLTDEMPDRMANVRRSAPRQRYFLGLRPAQRFALSLMLLLMACLLSVMCLLATGKVILPFMG